MISLTYVVSENYQEKVQIFRAQEIYLKLVETLIFC